MRIYTHMHTRSIYMHTYIHTYIHTHIHTYIHTYIHIYAHIIHTCNKKHTRNLVAEVGAQVRKSLLQNKVKLGWIICKI